MNRTHRERSSIPAALLLFLMPAAVLADSSTQNQPVPSKPLGEVTLKIVGGGPADQGQNRWITSLQSGEHFCGATLVADRWVVTAAHCVIGEKVGKLEVWVGGYDLRRPQDGQTVKIKKIHMHPNYNDNTLRNDVALLELQGSVDSGIPRAQLASTQITNQLAGPNDIVTVSGWGALSENGRSPNELHEVQLPVVSNGECKAAYDGDVHTTQICAGLREGGKDSCQGDSGGPLWATKQGKDYLVGIVSWGEGCAQARQYGVYTRVASFNDWIESTMAGSSNPDPNDDNDDNSGPGGGGKKSCKNKCGGKAKGCWCDADCDRLGDCCRDYEEICEGAQDSCTETVCGLDPYCCNTEWDFLCEELADDVC